MAQAIYEERRFEDLPVLADALEDAIWSAQRDTSTGYGIAVFDVDPGIRGAKTSITIRYYHAPGADKTPTATYQLFETVVLAKHRRCDEGRDDRDRYDDHDRHEGWGDDR